MNGWVKILSPFWTGSTSILLKYSVVTLQRALLQTIVLEINSPCHSLPRKQRTTEKDDE